MKKSRKIPVDLLNLDEKSDDGRFTTEKNLYPNLNMRTLIDYCKKTNTSYSSLNYKDLKFFETK